MRLRLLLLWPACVAASTLSLLLMLVHIVTNPMRAWVQAVSQDQNVNAAFGGNPDETISSRANRARLAGRSWGCILCRFLDLFEKNHCQLSAGV